MYPVVVIISYLLGSFSIAHFLAKVYNIDITKNGTKNPGATNVYLTIGPGWGVITAVIDLLKGAIPTYIAREVFQYDLLLVTGVALGAVIGHNWPLLNRFKGGRGLATTMGTIGVINLPKGLLAFIMGVIISLILRQHLKRDIRIWQVVYPFFIILFLYPVFNIYKIIYGMGIIFIASIRTWQIRSE